MEGKQSAALATLWFMLVVPAVLRAQKPGWHGAFEAAGNLIFGAARSRVASLTGNGSHADSAWTVRGDVLVSYSDVRVDSGSRQVNARASRLTFGIDRTPFAPLSPFWFGTVESSFQQRIQLRYSSGAGAKWTFHRKGSDDVSTSLALLWERTRLSDADGPRQPSESRARWSLRMRVRQALGPAVQFSHVTFYQPAVDRIDRFTTESNTSIAVKVNQPIAITLSLRDLYDSEARARGAPSNHDGQVLFGLRTTF